MTEGHMMDDVVALAMGCRNGVDSEERSALAQGLGKYMEQTGSSEEIARRDRKVEQ